MNAYRDPARRPESETMKLIKDNESRMLEMFARLLSVRNEHEIDGLARRLAMLAHERNLAIRIETQRLMLMPMAFSFLVVDGTIMPSPTSGEEKEG